MTIHVTLETAQKNKMFVLPTDSRSIEIHKNNSAFFMGINWLLNWQKCNRRMRFKLLTIKAKYYPTTIEIIVIEQRNSSVYI